MNAYLSEIIATQRIAELRREADVVRLAAAARRMPSDGAAGQSARDRWSVGRALMILRRRTA